MLASFSISTLLFLASAVVAQDTSSVVVVTSIASVPDASGGVFTIQTSIPGTSVCYEVCIQEPCPACSEGSMGIPPGETPMSPTESVASIITDPLLSTVSGFMSIPAGETPISVTNVSTLPSAASGTAPVSTLPTPTSSTTQQTTNAAIPLRVSDQVPLVLAAAFALL